MRDTNFNIAPNASSILGSLRNIGYDLKVALADLVDNSITALNNSNKSYKFIEICNNDISTSFPNLEWLSIVDNGIGMSENELINAFRLGGEGVDKDRGDKDLGRFGLGLKTASFSQCKKLTVISKKVDNEICALVFDLDAIEVSENWEVQRLSSEKQEYFFSAKAVDQRTGDKRKGCPAKPVNQKTARNNAHAPPLPRHQIDLMKK